MNLKPMSLSDYEAAYPPPPNCTFNGFPLPEFLPYSPWNALPFINYATALTLANQLLQALASAGLSGKVVTVKDGIGAGLVFGYAGQPSIGAPPQLTDEAFWVLDGVVTTISALSINGVSIPVGTPVKIQSVGLGLANARQNVSPAIFGMDQNQIQQGWGENAQMVTVPTGHWTWLLQPLPDGTWAANPWAIL